MSCLWLDVDANFINSVLGRTAIKGKYVNSAKHARVVCIPVRWKCSLAAVGFWQGKSSLGPAVIFVHSVVSRGEHSQSDAVQAEQADPASLVQSFVGNRWRCT